MARPTIASNIQMVKTESSDFPLVCENCLGDDPHVRMTKAHSGAACKICERAFTCFRWKAGKKGRFKSTIVCQLCSKMKNVCQCCLLDLELGIPVQLRDKFLAEKGHVPIPTSQVGIDYQVQMAQRALASGSTAGVLALESGYAKLADNPHLQRIAKTAPYYNRNEGKVCTFFLKGECNRGDSCPYRHERVHKDAALTKQDVRDRFHGVDDPVAKKMEGEIAAKMAKMPAPPEDESIRTLFITGIPVTVDTVPCEEFLRDQFGRFGTVEAVRIIPTSNCAFIEFETRPGAEAGMVGKFNNPEFAWEGTKLRVHWARPKGKPSGELEKLNVPYPSMDPGTMGNSLLPQERDRL
jgi:pre-mRNA-splicing factor RBM22/SLT11